jgi:Ca2+-binding RTX toxin-like protein
MVTRVMTFGKDNWPTDYSDNNAAADNITGTAAANTIDLGGGNDTVDGGPGDDNITGGLGKDTMTGGAGTDTFVYTRVIESSVAPDLIVDFKQGEDLLDLKQVDADVTQAGDQDFNLIFGAFTKHAAELRIDENAGRVEGDVDGDGFADLVIQFGSQVPSGGGQIAFKIVDDGTGNVDPNAAQGGGFGSDLIL